jgi:hypothetical protein
MQGGLGAAGREHPGQGQNGHARSRSSRILSEAIDPASASGRVIHDAAERVPEQAQDNVPFLVSSNGEAAARSRVPTRVASIPADADS